MLLGFSYLSKAQCTLPYKSLSQFNNDTTAFINYNFSERSACYVGKTMKDVINDLGLPILSFLVTNGYYNYKYLTGMYVYIYPYNTVCKYRAKKIYHNCITINWQTSTILRSTYDGLKDKNDRNKWTPQIANLFNDMVISQIDVVH